MWSQVTGGLKIQVDFYYKTLFSTLRSGLKSEGGLLAEWSLNTSFTVYNSFKNVDNTVKPVLKTTCLEKPPSDQRLPQFDSI